MFRVILPIILLFTFFEASTQKRSFQIWNQNYLEIGLNENTWIRFSEKIHYTPGNEKLDLKFADVFVAGELKHWLELGGGYRIAGIHKDFGWLTEQRPMVYGNIFTDSEKFEFNFSNRFEYRIFDKANNHFRHKQKFTVNFPVLTSWNLRFYVAEETFEKFNSDNLHLARLYAGLQAFQLKHYQLKLYYILEKYKRNGLWNTRDIIGLNLKFEI